MPKLALAAIQTVAVVSNLAATLVGCVARVFRPPAKRDEAGSATDLCDVVALARDARV
jgi:hypothetical protein